MEPLGCIYLLKNIHNGKTYVGQHCKPDPSGRVRGHIQSANRGSMCLIHIDIRKWGREAFTIDTLCVCPHSALSNLEAYFAEQYESYMWGHGYNMVWCSQQFRLGIKKTPEAIEKSRQGNLGKKMSPEAIEKTRQASLGRKLSPEAKEKVRQASLGRKHTPEVRERIRQAHLGKKKTPEARENMRQAQLAYWAKKRSEESM